MTTLSFKRALLTIVSSSRLCLADRSSGLERDAEVDRRAVGDTTLDTTRVVGLGSEAGRAGLFALKDDEGVVVDGAGDLAAAETGANLEALGCGDAEHRVAELSFQLVKAGLAETDGHVADHACYGSTDAVVVVAELFDDFGHARGGGGFRASDGGEGVDGLAVNCFNQVEEFWVRGGGGVFGCWGEEVLVADRGDEGDNFDVMRQAKVFFGDGTGGDTACEDWVSKSVFFQSCDLGVQYQ